MFAETGLRSPGDEVGKRGQSRLGEHRGKTSSMRQVKHFRSLFLSHFPVRSQSPARARLRTLCAACGSVILLHAARVFDYFVVIEIGFMDNQAQITETISRLDSEKVS